MPHPETAALAIDGLLDRVLAEQRLVGAVVLIQRDGRPFYSKAVGLADREAGTPMQIDTVFRLASMTKPIVSATVLACAEAGLLSIDDAVTRFLPDFRPKTPDGAAAPITIRHLLTHTSGLAYGFLQPGESAYHAVGVSDGIDRPGITLAENMRRLGQLPLSFVPGSAWQYSLATDVLGAVLEAATGQKLPSVVQDRITRPLGMTDSAFLAAAPERLATAYADPAAPGEAPRLMTDPFTLPLPEAGNVIFSPGRAMDPSAYASGGAGMLGTAENYMRFLEAIRLGGAPILSPASVTAFTGDAIPGLDIGPDDPGWGFGLGVSHLRDPAPSGTKQQAGAWAWGGVYGTSFWVDPEAGISAVALTNTGMEGCNGPFTKEIIAATYAERL